VSRKYRTVIPLSLLISFIGSCSTPAVGTTIPETAPTDPPAPLTIDGTIHPGEWDQAEFHEMSDGSELYLLQEGDIIFLAVDGTRRDALGANIFLQKGDNVRIMHISAALGTADYEFDGESWSLIRNFDWKHRTVGNSEIALAERQAYQELESWSAPNVYTGTTNHLEMQLDLGEGAYQIAVSLLRSSTDLRFVWPDGVTDDTTKAFSDGLTETINLNPESWHQIQ